MDKVNTIGKIGIDELKDEFHWGFFTFIVFFFALFVLTVYFIERFKGLLESFWS